MGGEPSSVGDGTGARRGVNSAGDGIDAKRWRFVEQGLAPGGKGGVDAWTGPRSETRVAGSPVRVERDVEVFGGR